MSGKPKKRGGIPSKKDLEILKRRNRILELRELGASYRQISERLINEASAALRAADPNLTAEEAERKATKGNSPTRVYELLVEALEDLYSSQRLKTKHLVQLEINKLQKIELAHFSRLLKATNPDSIEKLTRSFERIWKRYDGLLNLNKPQTFEITGAGGGPIETTTRVILPAFVELEEEPDA